MSEDEELRREALDLVRQTRALLAWHEECGFDAVPVEASTVDALAAVDAVAPPREPPPRGPERRTENRPSAPRDVVAERKAPSVEAQPTPAAPAAPVQAAPAAALAVLDGPARKQHLDVLAQKVASCQLCPLAPTRTQTVFARGNPEAELCFIGEGPGADEDEQGYPFVGKAGQLLDKMIVAMGYGRDDVYVCNIVKCRPPNNRKPEPAEMDACMPYLVEQLGVVRPKVIVALGATAVQGLIGTTEGITRLRGKWKLWRGTTPIMPTFHPAYLLRQPQAKRQVWGDLQEVLKHLGRSPPARR